MMHILEPRELWQRYRNHLWTSAKLGVSLDISRMDFDESLWSRMEPAMQAAFEAMRKLEAGEIANPDENRMVGHYWLRSPRLAPTEAIADAIRSTVDDVQTFARDVHAREITPPGAPRFTEVLLIGIGGSALGPQFMADALGGKQDKLRLHFLDNTDPDGIRRTLQSIGTRLKSTLVLVVSKSGGTAETRNGMLETQAEFEARGLEFAKHAVAITGPDSKLDQQAQREAWLHRFPMWDWVGGRTSVTSAVGLLPMALQGVNIRHFLDGAAQMDGLTRVADTRKNPAARLALMWHAATGGRGGSGGKDMVILPYKDRLLLFSRYLQQLVMESLGKKEDLDGNVVHQGISVYGNKGSTDQHAYVQQLRDGLNNFFVTFIVVLQDQTQRTKTDPVHVEDGITSGDYLNGFWQGTRKALYESGRESITLTLNRLDAHSIGALIALYERTVGLYAHLVNINAYHQPGVEAGKKAAGDVLELQQKVIAHLEKHPDDSFTAEQLAEAVGTDEIESIAHVLMHLAANKRHVKQRRDTYESLSASS